MDDISNFQVSLSLSLSLSPSLPPSTDLANRRPARTRILRSSFRLGTTKKMKSPPSDTCIMPTTIPPLDTTLSALHDRRCEIEDLLLGGAEISIPRVVDARNALDTLLASCEHKLSRARYNTPLSPLCLHRSSFISVFRCRAARRCPAFLALRSALLHLLRTPLASASRQV